MFVAFPNGPGGAFEVSPPYNGSAAHAAAAGVKRYTNQDPPGETVHYHTKTNSVVKVGYIFVRKVETVDGSGQPATFGPYAPAGDPTKPSGDPDAVRPDIANFYEVTFP
jgi:hypothetical protein